MWGGGSVFGGGGGGGGSVFGGGGGGGRGGGRGGGGAAGKRADGLADDEYLKHGPIGWKVGQPIDGQWIFHGDAFKTHPETKHYCLQYVQNKGGKCSFHDPCNGKTCRKTHGKPKCIDAAIYQKKEPRT